MPFFATAWIVIGTLGAQMTHSATCVHRSQIFGRGREERFWLAFWFLGVPLSRVGMESPDSLGKRGEPEVRAAERPATFGSDVAPKEGKTRGKKDGKHDSELANAGSS